MTGERWPRYSALQLIDESGAYGYFNGRQSTLLSTVTSHDRHGVSNHRQRVFVEHFVEASTKKTESSILLAFSEVNPPGIEPYLEPTILQCCLFWCQKMTTNKGIFSVMCPLGLSWGIHRWLGSRALMASPLSPGYAGQIYGPSIEWTVRWEFNAHVTSPDERGWWHGSHRPWKMPDFHFSL